MIIDYRVFYFIGLLNKLDFILLMLLIAGSFIYLFSLLIIIENLSYEKHYQQKLINKTIKIYIISITIILTAITLIPSRETMYKMLIFKNITHENIDKTQKNIKETVDYIFKKIEQLKER